MGLLQSVLRDSKKPVQVDMNMSRTEQILLKINLGPLAMLGLEDQSKVGTSCHLRATHPRVLP